MTFTGNGGAGGATVCTQPNFTGATAVQGGFNATQTMLTGVVVSGTVSCVGSTGVEVCTLPVTKSGSAAEFKWYNGWLATTTVSTAFATKQVYNSATNTTATSSTGGTVTLSQQPLLLTSGAVTPNPPSNSVFALP
jgi:hypothetical protein